MFRDREAAGEALAGEMLVYKDVSDALVLGLPRGGVITGSAVARALNLPLDVFLVQKLRAPGDPELAVGAVTETGSVYLLPPPPGEEAPPPGYLDNELKRQRMEIDWRRLLFRGGRPLPSLTGRIVIVVDDGVATGAAMMASLEALRPLSPKRLVAAAPVAPLGTAFAIEDMADEMVVLEAPERMRAVGDFYREFEPVSESAVLERLTLRRGVRGPRRRGPSAERTGFPQV